MAAKPTVRENFDKDWLFRQGDTQSAETTAFDDRGWKPVDLPHDWSIAGPFDEHAPATGSGGWLPTGVAWYRKHFLLPDTSRGERIFVEFDGVMDRSGVWINGHHVGYRPNGYVSFRYEITDFVNFGATASNVIAVRADTSAQPASRWYAGGGIYRHVRLVTSGPVHVDLWGTRVTTPEIDAQSAKVRVDSAILNQAEEANDLRLELSVLDPQGREVVKGSGDGAQLLPGRSVTLSASVTVADPHRWDIGDPALYKAVVTVRRADGTLLDQDIVPFGIREARFDAATGFWLNGRNIKLKGVAIHADGGAFGMAVPPSFYERRLKGLQALGINAVRTAHHPFSPEFLDLCDRLGILVMGEAFDMWTVAKGEKDYHLFFTDWSSIDARDFVRRDRNHPSIVIWSIGNEIHDTPYPLVAKSIVERLRTVFHREDPSRPVTMALFRPNNTGDYHNGLADMLDVVGQNYREKELAAAHADKPERKIIGTENSKNRDSWLQVRDNPAYAGMFLWTGADYLGEADRAGWPYISNPAGLVDRTDVVKPIGWERASWWSEKPVVKLMRRVEEMVDTSELPTMVGVAMPQPKGDAVLADWSPTDRSRHQEKVEVVSNAPDVELFLNGRSLGRLPRNADDKARAWTVAFEPGTLRAVGYRDGKVVGEDELRTAGKAVALKLTAEERNLAPDFDTVGYVRVEVVDAKGIVVPDASVPVHVTVAGSGMLAAFDNGSPTDHTAFTDPTRKTFHGRALVMVRATKSTGTIKIMATAPDLGRASTDLSAIPEPK